MEPFDRHSADPEVLESTAAELTRLASRALDERETTQRAFDPAVDNWAGVAAPELRAAGEGALRPAFIASSAVAWASVPLRYWATKVSGFNAKVALYETAYDQEMLIAAGSGLYIGAGLGPGPRDGLMTGLSRRSIAGRPISVRVARTFIEVVVLLVGIALGGAVGIGTVAFTLGIGPLVHVFLPPLTMDGPIGDVDVDPLSGDVVDPLTGETPTVP